MSASVASSVIGLSHASYSLSTTTTATLAPTWTEFMEVDNNIAEHLDDGGSVGDDREHDEEETSEVGQTQQKDINRVLAALKSSAPSDRFERTDETTALPEDAYDGAETPVEVASALQAHAALDMHTEGARLENAQAHLPLLDAINTPDGLIAGQLATTDAGMTDVSNAILADRSILSQDIPPAMDEDDSVPFPDLTPSPPTRDVRNPEAFAMLEFADGRFYVSTHQLELGRDQNAWHAALAREKEEKDTKRLTREGTKSKTTPFKTEQNLHDVTNMTPLKDFSGRASRRNEIIRAVGSQPQGSVISEAGGFAGIDERPHQDFDPFEAIGKSEESQTSDIVRPMDILHNPSLAAFDYNKAAQMRILPVNEDNIEDNEKPAPVTEEHMPNARLCPLIPIHVTTRSDKSEVASLRVISRRHVKIYWSSEHEGFFLKVQGVNGAFVNERLYGKGEHIRLHSGSKIQISNIEFIFRLPNAPRVQDDDDSLVSVSPTGESPPPDTQTNGAVKLKLKLNTGDGNIGPDGKRRGPGRPPKNGVMSQREMKERERAEKEARARAQNGGKTPPAMTQRKPSKSQIPKLEIESQGSADQTAKRKREDGNDDLILPSIEGGSGGEVQLPKSAPQPPVKRQRTKSESPYYKPKEECTEDELARPQHNYAVLLYMILSEGGEMSLRNIYKQMQARWPFFKYVVDSDGWTSSVRHNLNSEVGKLFDKGRKEGKGWSWVAIPNAMEAYQSQKNKRSHAPPAPKPRPAPPRPSIPAGQGQQLTWQNSGPYPQQGHPPGQFVARPPNGAPVPRPYLGMPPIFRGEAQLPWPYMPITHHGYDVFKQFVANINNQIKPHNRERYGRIIRSARCQVLHGYATTRSEVKEDELKDEEIILSLMQRYLTQYPNPDFRGQWEDEECWERTERTGHYMPHKDYLYGPVQGPTPAPALVPPSNAQNSSSVQGAGSVSGAPNTPPANTLNGQSNVSSASSHPLAQPPASVHMAPQGSSGPRTEGQAVPASVKPPLDSQNTTYKRADGSSDAVAALDVSDSVVNPGKLDSTVQTSQTPAIPVMSTTSGAAVSSTTPAVSTQSGKTSVVPTPVPSTVVRPSRSPITPEPAHERESSRPTEASMTAAATAAVMTTLKADPAAAHAHPPSQSS